MLNIFLLIDTPKTDLPALCETLWNRETLFCYDDYITWCSLLCIKKTGRIKWTLWLITPQRYLGYLVSIIGHPFRVRKNLQNLLQVFFIYFFITKLTKTSLFSTLNNYLKTDRLLIAFFSVFYLCIMRRVIPTKIHRSGVESLRGKETKIDELV